MTTPAKRHFQRVSAARQSEAPDAVRADATQYELMLAKLAEDRRRLKDVQSIERKADVKRQLLPEYAAWVEGALQGTGGQDDVLMTIMLWSIDVGDLANGLRIGRYAITHGLSMPDQYQRSTGCLLAEEFADTAIKAINGSGQADAAALQEVAEITAEQDMPDEVRAKLHKAIGYALRAAAEGADPVVAKAGLELARDHLQRALALHDKCGVKKDIERLETAIKNLAVAPAGDS